MEIPNAHATSTPSQIANLADPTACCFIVGLFQPSRVSAPVYGARDALENLKSAVENDGMSIHQKVLATPAQVFERPCRHLQRAGAFPTREGLYTLLNSTKEALLPLGIDPDELFAEAKRDVEEPSSLQFKEMNVALLLAVLKAAEAYHAYQSGGLQDESPVATYELGVLSMTETEKVPSFDVQLFRGGNRSSNCHTIWIYRHCVVAEDDYEELWYSFAVADTTALPKSTQSAGLPAPNSRKRSRADIDYADAEDDARIAVPNKRTTPKRRRHEMLTLARATPEEILSGNPDNVVQDAIFRVAQYYTNTEILNKLNATLRTEGRPEIKDVNNITQRIKLACASAGKRDGRTRVELRNELRKAREINGVIGRSKFHAKPSKEGGRAAKQLEQKNTAYELGDIESESATSSKMQTRSAEKGSERRTVDYTIDWSDDEYQGELLEDDDEDSTSEYLEE